MDKKLNTGNNLTIFIRNSDLAISKEKRAFLTYPSEGLANCSLEELEDGINLLFEASELEQAKAVYSMTKEQRYRFLINCADLESLYSEYDFSLSTDNLLVDINLRAQILMRDVKASNGNPDNERFLPRYKSLIGSFLIRKYTYEDFDKGGQDLYRKDKLLLELSKLETPHEIKARLIKEYHKTVNKTAQTKRLVSKRSAMVSRVAVPILTIALMAAGYFTSMALLFDIPYRNQVILANEAYIAGNPLEVQRTLTEFPVQNLTHETKHILSRSYVATEPISDAQRNNLLMGLTLITDTSIFDYWIHLGRLEFYEAIDIAQRFGDSELLLFAYIRQEAIVRADPHMPGSEKVTLLSYIEGRIDALQREREVVEEAMNNNGDVGNGDIDAYDNDGADVYGDYDQDPYVDSYDDESYEDEDGGDE